MNNPEMPPGPESGDLELIARTLSLRERVSELPDGVGSESEARVAAWARRVSPEGDDARFRLRLSWLGLDEEGAKRVASRRPSAAERPPWFDIAEQVRGYLASEPMPDSVHVAFGEYWQGWGAVARARLEQRLAASGCELPSAVLAELERGLVSELASIGSSCLMSAFDQHRLPWQLGPGHLIARLSSTPPTRLYQSFVRELRTSRMVWTRWPTLIRLAATRVGYWVAAIGEFADRLHADRPALSARLGRELGSITSLRDRVSDSHNGARRVFLVGFGDDLTVVYKPRGVRSELAFDEILAWTHERLPEGPELGRYWVLDRETHGWTELVEPAACPEAETARYYERAGMLLALAYVLVGSDCHEGNVIAAGDCPMLVDLETFAGPQLEPLDAGAPEYAEAAELLETESVLGIGLLPGWTWNRPGAADASGFGGENKGRLFRFAHLNTDLMRLVSVDGHAASPSANQPRLASGAAVRAERHVDSILRGFERVYRLVHEQRDDFLRPDGPLASLRDGLARVVFRDTSHYAQLLGASLKPPSMEDGFARSVSLEGLTALLTELEPVPDWAAVVLEQEQEALLRGDIPLFLVDRTSGTLFVRDPDLSENREIGRMDAAGAGIRRLESRLRRLGPEDLRVQRQCIESAFVGRAIRIDAVPTPAAAGVPGLLEIALSLARSVEECSVSGPRGGRFWLGLEPESGDRDLSRVGVLGPWLYSGQAGIALALSAAFARSHEPVFARAALEALAPIRELLDDAGSWPLGAFDGISGIIYVLSHAARLLGEPALMDDARRLLFGLRRDALESDELFDVTSGVAGLILALRCLEPLEKERVHDVVGVAARHLVGNAKRFDDGVGWANWIEPNPLCGVAHGNSGIAWALMEAFRMTGDRAFREVAVAATDYERARRSETTDGAWPDLRKRPGTVSGWCHGPAGIALARCAMLEISDSAELRTDLQLARQLIRDRTASEQRAYLCCGQTGIDDALLELGRRLGDSASIDEAHRRASSRIASLGDNPDRWMHSGLGERGLATIPSLMKGWSGIVLALLRLSDPGRDTPSVLTLAP